jgi:hypothetical protein
MGYEYFLTSKYNKEEIKKQVVLYSNIDESAINFIESDVDESDLFIDIDYFKGDFLTRIRVYEKPNLRIVDMVELGRYLAISFAENALISHWHNNPFLWILIDSEGNLFQVDEKPVDKIGWIMINRQNKVVLDLEKVKIEINSLLYP